jgi:hypothetical protein
MEMARIHILQCILDSQEYGSDAEHMISRIFFDITFHNETKHQQFVTIKQTVGSNYETGPIEVSFPDEYKGPFDYEVFRDEVEKYFRSLIGKQGKLVRMNALTKNAHLHNITINSESTFDIPVEPSDKGGW